MSSNELRRRARELGVATSFVDAAGQRRRVSDATLEAVLAAMGADAAGPHDPRPPVVVLRRGASRQRLPRRLGELLGGEPLGVVLESGEERPAPRRLPGDLPLGYHRVEGDGWSVPLVVAPPHCHLPERLERGGRAWGFAAQLYGLHSRASWGFGDLGDLAQLAGPSAAGALGAAFVLVNPLHAAPPSQPSPYFPSSRLFRNPLYLRVEAVPELAGLDQEGRARVAELAAAGRRLGTGARIDREAVHQLKDEALRRCYRALDGDRARAAGLAAYRAATEGLDQFATFCGLQGELGPDWRAWPAAYRRPAAEAVRRWAAGHAGEVRYHAWLQWLLEEQLAAVPPHPVGPHGQDWGLPPFVPARLGAAGYQPFARTVRAGMAQVQGLRIDHVMGLFRLYWVPEGRPPTEGTYVRYPADDLLGVVALESARAGSLVIGEDLGTVAPGVRERLAAERILSYRLAWFERDPGDARPVGGRGRRPPGRRRAADYPRLALAAAARQEAEGEELRALLAAEGLLRPGGDGDAGELIAALHAFLARTPSMLVAATLEDAVASTERPNVPGTVDQHPNWSLPLPLPLEELAADPRVRRLAGVLAAERPLPSARPQR